MNTNPTDAEVQLQFSLLAARGAEIAGTPVNTVQLRFRANDCALDAWIEAMVAEGLVLELSLADYAAGEQAAQDIRVHHGEADWGCPVPRGPLTTASIFG